MGWALIKFFCLLDGRLFEVGTNSRLGAYSNKYGTSQHGSSSYRMVIAALGHLSPCGCNLVFEMSTYRCQVCSAVEEKKTRRHEDLKMTQRLATTTQAHSDATKTESQQCPEENSTTKRGVRRLEHMELTPRRQQTITRRTIFEVKKCFQDHDAIFRHRSRYSVTNLFTEVTQSCNF